MKTPKVLVLGGTGKTGKRIVAQLQLKGIKTRIGSRNHSPAFDWNEPDRWGTVLNGIDRVYINYHPDLAVPGAYESIAKLLTACKSAQIEKVVLLSGKGESEAERCENLVASSGINYTIVRASWFNQNFSESFLMDPILDGFVALPQAEVKIPFVDANDIAAVVVEALLNNNHNGKTYQLTGERGLTFKEAIAIIAKSSNRPITFVPISIPEYVEGMKKAGIPADFVWLIEYLFTEVLGNPNNAEITSDIEKVLGRTPIPFESYAQTMAASGFWHTQSKTAS
ncbi:NmrA family NAD(P)-binding protein [Sediminicola luteus]|uniref:NmrA family transcriptional regulator n=1 Tax=Sediminicola luteus TaxID=319238 RepID=A0A2A4G7X1_9FLAO|nr:NmrA family NAD(P)-binding protein [Sediminicola luteus]PCE64078.1 NmrA family transcriptional regulator [Sediminicola luteus]